MSRAKQQPPTIATSPLFGVLSTAAMGALTLIDPSKLNTTQRRDTHVATAVLTGAYVAFTIGGARRKRALLRTVAGLAAAGVTMRFADAGDSIDARLEQKLRLAGVKHPRRWMAAGAAALTFAGFIGDRIAARQDLFEAMPLDELELEQMLPVDLTVRRLVEGILGAAEIAGAPELLAQLQSAQEVYRDDRFPQSVQFQVPDELPRAVPHDHVFPIRGRYTGAKGIPLEIRLQVFDGKLDHLAIDAADPENTEDIDSLLEGWPEPSEVTYVLEGPDGNAAPIGR